jgi:hypothetical protein
MLESNPPRNSQLETHPDDEPGRGPKGLRPDRLERSPHASRNSYRKLLRSGLLTLDRQTGLELGGW